MRCETCGFENPHGALVCRRCRRRLRVRPEAVGPRRETEGELTLTVADELVRLAWMIGAVLTLGVLLTLPLYRRVEPVLVVVVVVVVLLAAVGRRFSARLRAQASPR